MRRRLGGLIAAVAVIAGCGGEERREAVEATEEKTVRIGGLRYDVVLFRELNVRQPPDDAVYSGDPPPDEHGLYAVSLRACNTTDRIRTATDDIVLEDAFGQVFRPRSRQTVDRFEFQAGRVRPERCIPGSETVAARAFDGGALIVELPFDAVDERPLILEIRGPGDEKARVQLDV